MNLKINHAMMSMALVRTTCRNKKSGLLSAILFGLFLYSSGVAAETIRDPKSYLSEARDFIDTACNANSKIPYTERLDSFSLAHNRVFMAYSIAEEDKNTEVAAVAKTLLDKTKDAFYALNTNKIKLEDTKLCKNRM